jgi:ABC-type multidrug transport system ATPase subunit
MNLKFKESEIYFIIFFQKVVITIHQPSSRLMDHFDNLYIVANGFCIYQGPTGSLVSYLKTVNLNCPSYHNPADFGK